MKLIPFDPDRPDEDCVKLAVDMLAKGELVVGPTETRYGLMAKADDAAALEKLFAAKQRGVKSPSAIFCRDYAAVAELAMTNSMSDRLAEAFLPGPLTLVLKALRELPEELVLSGKVGLRVSSSPFVEALLDRVDFPVTATSANLSGSGDVWTAREIARDLGDHVSLILDAGPLNGPTSTVVDCSGEELLILREGAIKNDLIDQAIGGVQ